MSEPIILDEIPTDAEKESAENFFRAMEKAGFSVKEMSRILKHLGAVLVLYAEATDVSMRRSKAALDELVGKAPASLK